MTSEKQKPPSENDDLLHSLFNAIAARDRLAALKMLKTSPQLARAVVSVGATRGNPKDFFFDAIKHYAYASDTALHMAAAAYQLDVVKTLVSMNANVRARNRRGAEPLHYACDGSPGSVWWNPDAQAAVIQALLAAGADPEAADKRGVTPLHRAVRTRCTPAVKTLLASGADVRRRNGSGSTPLHLAVQDTGRSGAGAAPVREEQAAVIRELIDHGAHPSDMDAAGKSVAAAASAEWIRIILGTSARR